MGLYNDNLWSSRMNPEISVGDIIGQYEGSEDEAVDVEIVYIFDDNSILAKVVKLGSFYSAQRLTGENNDSKGLSLEEYLFFQRNSSQDGRVWWNIISPRNRPWHSLGLIDGKKYFYHYR